MIEIKLVDHTNDFAENKDVARDLRREKIVPALDNKDNVIINFDGVNSATQSFVHALISELIRSYGVDVLDSIQFKNCNDTIKKIIGIVVDYMQQSD